MKSFCYKIVAFTLFLLISFQELHAQSPLDVSGMLAWFHTIQDDNNPKHGRWVDLSGFNSNLDEYDDLGEYLGEYRSDIFTINYNPALSFLTSNKIQIDLPENHGNELTVIAVIAPISRDVDQSQWILYSDENATLSSLGTSTYQYVGGGGGQSNYGIFNEGADLFIPNSDDHLDELDRRGKIVTTELTLDHDRCLSINEIQNQILQLTPSVIPELLVFDHMLEDDDRGKIEEYLAIKYGMSTIYYRPDQDYINRVTGIMAEDPYLNQSRSTSYYDEFDDGLGEVGQFDLFQLETDQSYNKNRLLVIGIEDESSDIRMRWGNNGPRLSWGDDDEHDEDINGKLLLDDNNLIAAEYGHLTRNWKVDYVEKSPSVPAHGISWCNFVNLMNLDKEIDGSKFQRQFADGGPIDSDRDGVCASSMSVAVGNSGALEWQVSERGSNQQSIVGLSKDNVDFVGNSSLGNVENYKGFVYAVYMNHGDINVLVDDNDDGVQSEFSLGQSYLEGQALRIELNISSTHYTFDLFRGNDANPIDSRSIEMIEESSDLFAKIILMDSESELEILGSSGFEQSELGSTSLELSYERVRDLFPGVELGTDELVLLIDRSGTGNYPTNDVEIFPGSLSRTPNHSFDKVEWCGIKWQSGDVFTFGHLVCDSWIVYCEDPIYDCCGNGAYVPFTLGDCYTSRPFEFTTDGGANWEMFNYGEPQVAYIENGGELVVREFTSQILLEQCSLDINNPNQLNYELEQVIGGSQVPIIDNRICFNNTDDIEIIVDWMPSFPQVNYTWKDPNGNTIGTNQSIVIPTGASIGVYTVEIWVSCDPIDANNINCSVIEEIEICRECDLTVKNGPCNTVAVVLRNAPKGCADSHTLKITDQGNNQVGPLIPIQFEVPLIIPSLFFTDGQLYNFEVIPGDGACCRFVIEDFLYQENSYQIFQEDEICIEEGECITLNAMDPDIPSSCFVSYLWSDNLGINSTAEVCLDYGSYVANVQVVFECSPFIPMACAVSDNIIVNTNCLTPFSANEDETDCQELPSLKQVYHVNRGERLPNPINDIPEICDYVLFKNNERVSQKELTLLDIGQYRVHYQCDECSSIINFEIKEFDGVNGILESKTKLVDFKYTNPISDDREYQFVLSFDTPQKVRMDAYNDQGKHILEKVETPKKLQNFGLQLKSGIYFIRFSWDKEHELLKLIVQ